MTIGPISISKQRLPYIDFMKGVCIILIVAIHICEDIFPQQVNAMLQAFRVPLYYFLSGLFFKDYGGFGEFTRKKTNNILVPFVFFYLMACGLAIVCSELLHLDEKGLINDSWQWGYLLDPIFERDYHYSVALWFLLSLFEVNIIYYFLQRYLSPVAVATASIAISLSGWFLGLYDVILPLMLDTALLGLPYFVLGVAIRRQGALQPAGYDKYGLLAFPLILVLLYFVAENLNIFDQILPGYIEMYLTSFAAIIGFLWFSKNLPYIPVISYFGRYSLIVLGTHSMILSPVKAIGYKMLGGDYWVHWAILVAVFAIELAIIPIVVRLFPRFTAQKDLIKAKSALNNR